MDRTELKKNVEQWCDTMFRESEAVSKFIYASKYDDTSGYGNVAMQYFRQLPKRAGGLWLCGPEGCGKHTAANFAVKFLRDIENAEYKDMLDDSSAEQETEINFIPTLFLSGTDIPISEDPAAASDILIDCLLDPYMKDAGVCLVLEDMDQCSSADIFLTKLGRRMCRFWDLQADPMTNLLVILIDTGKLRVPPVLRQHLLRCDIQPPTFNMRYMYIRKRWKQLRSTTGAESFPELSHDQLAELTEGCTFRQLADITEQAFYLDQATDYTAANRALPHTDIANAGEEAQYLYQRLSGLTGTGLQSSPGELNALEIRAYEDRHAVTEAMMELLPDFITNQLPELIKAIGRGRGGSGGSGGKEPREPVVGPNTMQPMSEPSFDETQKRADAMTGGALAHEIGLFDDDTEE